MQRLHDMLPQLSLANLGDGNGFNAKRFSKLVIGSVLAAFSYLMNLVRRKNGTPVEFPFSICASALSFSVCIVVSLCSEEKVVGVYADRVVALVAHAHAGWHISDHKDIRHHMRHPVFLPESNLSIFVISPRSVPNPAVRGIANRRPAPKQWPNGFWNLDSGESSGLHPKQILNMALGVNHEYA